MTGLARLNEALEVLPKAAKVEVGTPIDMASVGEVEASLVDASAAIKALFS